MQLADAYRRLSAFDAWDRYNLPVPINLSPDGRCEPSDAFPWTALAMLSVAGKVESANDDADLRRGVKLCASLIDLGTVDPSDIMAEREWLRQLGTLPEPN